MTVKSRLLKLLEQHKGETMSGERLAEELTCTRAAVWKAVKALREEGYTIDAGPNKGYMLARDSNRLSVEALRLYLNAPQAVIKIYDQVNSTNQCAKKAAVSGEAGHGSFVMALEQTAGRGRRGRAFYSPRDAGLYLSVILEPEETLKESLLITTAAAAAVYKAVRNVCGVSLDIKWVNDLYRDGRKVCGILTEAVTDFENGDIQFAVVGIGLNLYLVKDELPSELAGVAGAVFDSREEAETADRNRLAAEIVNVLLEETKDLKLSREYVEQNIVPGREIEIIDGERSRHAKALSVCEDGRLLVEEQDGRQSRLSYGEVSVCIKGEND